MHPIVELCAKVCEELGDKREEGYATNCECASAIRALTDAEIAAVMGKAGEAVAVSRDWPHEQTHQHVCEKCGQEYKGWQRSASCYACYVKYYAPCAAPAALPEEPTDAMAMAIYGALQSSGTDGWKYLATHQREKYMRAARALLSAAQGAEK